MVRLRETNLRTRRINEKALDGLRASIAAGCPWVTLTGSPRGHSDLHFLVRGHLYFPEFIRSNDDIETALEMWGELRENILEQHISREPLTRPWSFYGLEDRPPRIRIKTKTPCSCPPGSNHPGLAPLHLSWFGRPPGCRCEHETEGAYLKRLGLLTAAEKAALREQERDANP